MQKKRHFSSTTQLEVRTNSVELDSIFSPSSIALFFIVGELCPLLVLVSASAAAKMSLDMTQIEK